MSKRPAYAYDAYVYAACDVTYVDDAGGGGGTGVKPGKVRMVLGVD